MEMIQKLNSFLVLNSMYFRGMAFDEGDKFLKIRGLSFKMEVGPIVLQVSLKTFVKALVRAIKLNCEDEIEQKAWITDLQTFKTRYDATSD